MASFRARALHTALILSASFIALGTTVSGQAPAQPWAGHYAFVHDGGRTAGGSPIVVTYRLDIASGRGNRDCLLRIEGFQTDETIVCKLDGDATSVAVKFHTYGDGRLVNAYGTKLYEIGTTLFALRRTGPVVLTEWQALGPDGVRRGTAGTAFERQR